MTKIAVLVGSLRAGSFNHQFAKAVEGLAPEGVTFEYADIASLPLFNQDVEASEFPKTATALKELIESADGVLVVTPEYNRGYPGVLKNAIDWASRPWGSNSFDKKPVSLAGVSIGSLGTTQAQSQLRNVFVYLNTKLMGQPEAYINGLTFFNEDGTLPEGSDEKIKEFTRAFLAHVDSNKAKTYESLAR